MPGITTRPPSKQPNSRFNRWLHGWLLGQQGLGGATTRFAQSVDPRTPQGLLGAMSMMIPGKASGDAALAAHMGHSEFRPYHAVEGRNYEGVWTSPDQFMLGGQTMHGRDYGQTANDMLGMQLRDTIAKVQPANNAKNLLYSLSRSYGRKGLGN